jgi:hypothetical protein
MKDVAALLRGLRHDDGADSRKTSGAAKWAEPRTPGKPAPLRHPAETQTGRPHSSTSSSLAYSTTGSV